MKIHIEIDETIKEEEVVIRCNSFDENVQNIQKVLNSLDISARQLSVFKHDTEYFLSLKDIIFFETSGNIVVAHTANDMFETKYKLYELEDILPGYFMRVSKSTILNTQMVYSICRNLTASSLVEFSNSHKQVYVSRNYYKPLKQKLDERRLFVLERHK